MRGPKKLLLTLAVIFSAICLYPPVPVAAINLFGDSPGTCDVNTANNSNCGVCDYTNASTSTICQDQKAAAGKDPIFGTDGIVGTALSLISLVVGIAAVLVIIFSGLRMILASGDGNSLASARQALIFALVGLAIAAVARLIVVFVLNKI